MPTLDVSAPQRRRWSRVPADLTIIVVLTAVLWIVTAIGQSIDLDRTVSGSLHTEADAWTFALTLGPLYLLIKGIASIWGIVVGIPTALLVMNLTLVRMPVRLRWSIAGTVAAAIFIGVPMMLESQEQLRLARAYRSADIPGLPSLAGRAVELPSATPLEVGMVDRIDCRATCLDLLTFGQAKSVTLVFRRVEREADNGLIALNYRLGTSAEKCQGPKFNGFCAVATSAGLPRDRLIVLSRNVSALPQDDGAVVARRLVISDTRHPAAQATLTRVEYSHYSSLLNIELSSRGFGLVRGGLPIAAREMLEERLFRDLVGTRVFHGEYYPFR